MHILTSLSERFEVKQSTITRAGGGLFARVSFNAGDTLFVRDDAVLGGVDKAYSPKPPDRYINAARTPRIVNPTLQRRLRTTDELVKVIHSDLIDYRARWQDGANCNSKFSCDGTLRATAPIQAGDEILRPYFYYEWLMFAAMSSAQLEFAQLAVMHIRRVAAGSKPDYLPLEEEEYVNSVFSL